MRVVVLAAPCLHLGYLGCYGCDWVGTPHLDRLAAEGIVFDQHFADTPVRRTHFHDPSDGAPNRSWWTGRYFFPDRSRQEMPGAAEAGEFLPWLEAQGIATVRVIAHSRLDGFGDPPSLRFPRRRLVDALTSVEKASRFLAWVDLPSLAPPWPLLPERHWRHYFPAAAEDEEPLTPWTDPPRGTLELAEGDELERLQATYATVMTYFDAQVGQLLEELRAHQWYDNLLLVFTADRGLALGEHGRVGDAGPGLHEELIHLPLVVRLPGGAEAGRRVAALTRPVDLHPTLLDALGLPPPAVHGQSLLPLARGTADQLRACACAGSAVDGAVQYTLRTPDWSFLVADQPGPEMPRQPQLFVKPDDRWEVNNVVQHHLDLAQRLGQTLDDFVAATRQPGPFRAPRLPADEAENSPEGSNLTRGGTNP